MCVVVVVEIRKAHIGSCIWMIGPQYVGPFSEGLGSMTLFEVVCHWGLGSELSKAHTFPIYLSLCLQPASLDAGS